jgi:predicted nucleotidyltransferase
MAEVPDTAKRIQIVEELTRQLVEALQHRLGKRLVSVILYGSYARGQSEPDSDVDLLIVAEGLPSSSLGRQSFLIPILIEIENPYRESLKPTGWFPYVSAVVKTPEEADCVSRIYFDMVEEAKILFDREDFFQTVLRKVQTRLKDLGARKVQVGKMWYWDLKPDYRPGEIFEI